MKKNLILSAFLVLNVLSHAQTQGVNILGIRPVPAGSNTSSEWFDLASNSEGIALSAKTVARATRTEPVIKTTILPLLQNGFVKVDLGAKIPSTVVLTDDMGKTILQKNLETQRIALDLSDLSSGNYILTVETGKGRTTQKLVINH